MSELNKKELIEFLCQGMASGKFDPKIVLPAIQELFTNSAELTVSPALWETLEQNKGRAATNLLDHLKASRRIEAFKFHQMKIDGKEIPATTKSFLADLPLEAPFKQFTAQNFLRAIRSVLLLIKDFIFISAKQEQAPLIAKTIESKYQDSLTTLPEPGIAWDGVDPVAIIEKIIPQISDQNFLTALAQLKGNIQTKNLARERTTQNALDQETILLPVPDEDFALRYLKIKIQQAPTRLIKEKYVDLLCYWPSTKAIPTILELADEAWIQERATLLLTLRFGEASISSWAGWRQWLLNQQLVREEEIRASQTLFDNNPAELLLMWCHRNNYQDPALRHCLAEWGRNQNSFFNINNFFDRWGDQLPSHEWEFLSGKPAKEKILERIQPEIAPIPALQSTEEPFVLKKPIEEIRPMTKEKPVRIQSSPPPPSLWNDHIHPFITKNWPMVAGLAMVIVGSSLLAYYTWDKHWLLRFTIMPALLGVFTVALARVGNWIEKQAGHFKGTAAVLRGAAVGLLPANFMALALLANDPQVIYKPILVPLAAAVYLFLFGIGLRKWCSAVYEPLGGFLAGCLIFLNSLVALGPVAQALSSMSGQEFFVIIGTGFHLGFVVLAATVILFVKKYLTKEMAEEKRIPWFFGATLTITFIEVFVWVHGFIRHLPEVYTYAPMVILIGGLILFLERRVAGLKAQSEFHQAESFLGFAFIFMGVLMGASQPWIRIASFLLAGLVWTYQSISRKHVLHYWIGLTFINLAGASVATLEGFPTIWQPAIGIVLALIMGAFSRYGESNQYTEFKDACIGMQVSILMLTAMVATLTQWHLHSSSLQTAVYLSIVGLMFAWRAYQDKSLRWVHTTMMVVAITLPYLGCIDMEGRTLHGNTMVFGLAVVSILWMTLIKFSKSSLLLEARSTVLWLYGLLAVVGMALRVVFEQGRPGEAMLLQFLMDNSGPILMAIVLIYTAYYSRSLIPSAMAIGIVVILLPELKTEIQLRLPFIAWGTGFLSSVLSLTMMLSCFRLRNATSLHNLSEGDTFFGRTPFPCRRHDHTLFTWPLLAAVLFMAIKVDTVNMIRNMIEIGLPLKTAIALAITGLVWTLYGIYERTESTSLIAIYLGWLELILGFTFGYFHQVPTSHWYDAVLIVGLTLNVAYLFYEKILSRQYSWVHDLLTRPTKNILQAGSLYVAFQVALMLFQGSELLPFLPLLVFIAIQLVWHGLDSRHEIFGTVLFLLSWFVLMDWTSPGNGSLLNRITIQNNLTPTLLLFSFVLGFTVLLEAAKSLYEKGKSLLDPALTIVSLTLLILAAGSGFDLLSAPTITLNQNILLLVLIFITARIHSSGSHVFFGLILGYMVALSGGMSAISEGWAKSDYLMAPWRLSLFSLIITVLAGLGTVIKNRWPTIMAGPYAQASFKSPARSVVFLTAVSLAIFAGASQSFNPLFHNVAMQLCTPYFSAATLILIGWMWNRSSLFFIAGLFVTLGNIHTVRFYFGELLRSKGVMENHLICLGFGATLIQGSLLRRLARKKEVIVYLNRFALALAGLILIFLSATYFAHPNLTMMSNTRFIISGVMAYLAGLYFHRASRHPDSGEERYADLCEGLYHFAVTITIWCAALLMPFMKNPNTSFVALGLPALYFYLRAEFGKRSNPNVAIRYRNSTALLSFAILAFYVFRAAFQWIVFPDLPVFTDHYHVNAPFIITIGLLMFRLCGLGGTSWLAFYGGISLMMGSYFTLTIFPGLSPFDFPIPSAWCALALGHFWTLASHQRSPLRSFIQDIGAINEKLWFSLRQSWGWCLLAAVYASVIYGLSDYSSNTYMVAPLLAGLASILIHQGLARKSSTYFTLAGLELFFALHADFIVPSYLAKDNILWVLLGLWALILLLHVIKMFSATVRSLEKPAFALATVVMAHVLYHHPSSPAGLWGVALMGILMALTPCETLVVASGGNAFASLLLLIPSWLVYFSQAPLQKVGLSAAFLSWPIITTCASLLMTGSFARLFKDRFSATSKNIQGQQPRLFHQTLSWMGNSGDQLNSTFLWLTFIVIGMLQVHHYSEAWPDREFFGIVGLYAMFSFAWFYEGKIRRDILSYVMLELSIFGFFAVLRRQLMLTTNLWTYEYDVWASLGVSILITGLKQGLKEQPREVLAPMVGTIFALPTIAIAWVMIHNLGTNTALLVVGLHSMMFTFMGKDDKESPYNLVAVGGFVAFILIVFASKFQLQVIHAYVIPVGLGILILLHLFSERIHPMIKNQIRFVTLLAMLGSTGYYALLDDRYTILFNLTLIFLALFVMALGSILRVRVYIGLGFVGLITDLCSLVYKVLAHMDHSSRMTIVGSQVLILGATMVFGAIYYKTHQDKLNERFRSWRHQLAEWE